MEDRSRFSGTRYGVPVHRKEVAERLAEAYSQDMLDQREFEARLDRAEQATTIEDLDALVADFSPGARPGTLPVLPSKAVVTAFSEFHHTLVPGVHDGYRVTTWVGEVHLDLLPYQGSGKTVLLRVSGAVGEVVIRVPHGTKVDFRGRVVLGEYRMVPAKVPGRLRQFWDRLFGSPKPPPSTFPADGPPPTLILEGTRFLGNLTIREESL